MVLNAVGECRRNIRSEAQVLQCPQRADHNARPNDSVAAACTFAPRGNTLRCAETANAICSIKDQAAATDLFQLKGSPDRHTLCRMTDSLRASAVRALPGPHRLAIASAQSLRREARLTRVRMTTAASYINVRARWSRSVISYRCDRSRPTGIASESIPDGLRRIGIGQNALDPRRC